MALPIVGTIGLGSIGALIQSISNLFTSPALQIFNTTLRDMAGVVGQSLTPVFRIFNTVARLIGDTMATIAPSVSAVFGVLEDSFKSIYPILDRVAQVVGVMGVSAANALAGILKTFMTLFDGLGSGLKRLEPVFRVIEDHAARFGLLLQEVFGSIFDLAKTVGGAFASLFGVNTEFIKLDEILTGLSRVIVIVGQSVKALVDNFKAFITGGDTLSFSQMWAKIMANTDRLMSVGANRDRRSSIGAGATNASYMDLGAYENKIREAAFGMGQGLSHEKKVEGYWETLIKEAKLARLAQEQVAVATGVNGAIGGFVANGPLGFAVQLADAIWRKINN